jgi:Spy/CpxP family protein refolding chaperone
MNRRVIFLSAFAAVLMMSLVAYGQQRPGQRGPGGRGFGSAMLLRAEAVQKELGVTAEQLTKLKDVLEAGRGAGGGQRNQDMTEEERTKAREERAKQVAEQDKKIGEILKPEQIARLKQIRLQVAGARAVTDEEAAKELKITDEQKTKIEKVMQEMRDAMQGGGGGGPGAFAEMREKINAKVMEILTDEQKAKYKEMLGKPFDTSQLRMGGPGGERRGGGN